MSTSAWRRLSSLFAPILTAIVPTLAAAENQPAGSTIVATQSASGAWGPGTIYAASDVTIQSGAVIVIAIYRALSSSRRM